MPWKENSRWSKGARAALDARRERLDVARLGVIVLDYESVGRRGPARERCIHAIERGRRRGRGVLRVERQHDDLRRARRPQLSQCAGDRGIAVGHAHRDRGRLRLQAREPARECAGQRLGAGKQRRPRGRPHLLIGLCASRGPERQDQGPAGRSARECAAGRRRARSDRNSARKRRTAAGVGASGVPRLTTRTPVVTGMGQDTPRLWRAVRTRAHPQKKRPGVSSRPRMDRGRYQLRRTPANITFASSPMRYEMPAENISVKL